MARLIKFKAQCHYCNGWFEKGQTYLQKVFNKITKRSSWKCQCFDCYKKRKEDE